MSIIFVSFITITSIIVCTGSLAAASCYVIDHYDEGWKGALHTGIIFVSLFLSIWLGMWLANNTCEVRCDNCQTEWVATSDDNVYCHVCGTKLERRK